MPRVHSEEPAEGPRDPKYYEQQNDDDQDASQQADASNAPGDGDDRANDSGTSASSEGGQDTGGSPSYLLERIPR